MKAKIVKLPVRSVVEITSLDEGNWFIDSHANLCLRTDEGRYVVLEDGLASLIDADDEQVTPIQVTITY